MGNISISLGCILHVFTLQSLYGAESLDRARTLTALCVVLRRVSPDCALAIGLEAQRIVDGMSFLLNSLQLHFPDLVFRTCVVRCGLVFCLNQFTSEVFAAINFRLFFVWQLFLAVARLYTVSGSLPLCV